MFSSIVFSTKGPCSKEEMEDAILYARIVVREYEAGRADITKQYEVARAMLSMLAANVVAAANRHVLGEGYPWYQANTVQLLEQPTETFKKDSAKVVDLDSNARVSNDAKVRLVLELVD